MSTSREDFKVSEKSYEHLKPHVSPEHKNQGPEHHAHPRTPEKHGHRHEHQENIDDIQKSIEKHAKHSHESAHRHTPEATSGPSEAFVNKELKVMAFDRTMSRVRRSLSPADRTLSRIIHKPAVDAVSSALDKTVARPSAILGGGMIAALGGIVYYYVAKKYGYDYNATVLIVLFLSGYLGGLLVDAVRKLASPR